MQRLKEIINSYGPTRIKGGQFFLAWNSVMTLAFDGFSPAILAIKKEIKKSFPELPQENSGSKWPKISIGCLNDNMVLSDSQVMMLRTLCEEYNTKRYIEKNNATAIDKLKLLKFQCRSLEQRDFEEELKFNSSLPPDNKKPDIDHANNIRSLIKDFYLENHNDYLKHLRPEGRTMKSYYRAPHSEMTLIYDFNREQRLKFSPVINKFCGEVDAQMPGMFSWFDEHSWHITIRNWNISD